MLDCEAIRPWLGAHLDGEDTLVPREALRLHLERCLDCARHVRALQEFLAALAAAHQAPEVPASVVRKVAWVRWSSRGSSRATLAVAALSLLLVVAAFGAWPAPGSDLLAETVALQQALSEGRLPLDHRGEDPELLSRVLSERLGATVDFTQVAHSGLQLRGARWLGADGKGGAVVLFSSPGQGRDVALAVRPVSGQPRARPRFQVTTREGRRVVSWEHGQVGYTLVAGDGQSARQGCGTCHLPGSPDLDALDL